MFISSLNPYRTWPLGVFLAGLPFAWMQGLWWYGEALPGTVSLEFWHLSSSLVFIGAGLAFPLWLVAVRGDLGIRLGLGMICVPSALALALLVSIQSMCGDETETIGPQAAGQEVVDSCQ